MKLKYLLLSLIAWAPLALPAEQILKQQLSKSNKGDFIVTAQEKTRVLLNIYDIKEGSLTLEEIIFPSTAQQPCNYPSWREWVAAGAPGHTSWTLYLLDTNNGVMDSGYSFSQQSWIKVKNADQFLSTLVNLDFAQVADSERKRVGGQGGSAATRMFRPVWQPKMIVDGNCIPNVLFDAWKARWPSDQSELSGKLIEIYLPQESGRYATYFPYWLQISGMIGKARVRIIDSGAGMQSPKPSLDQLQNNPMEPS